MQKHRGIPRKTGFPTRCNRCRRSDLRTLRTGLMSAETRTVSSIDRKLSRGRAVKVEYVGQTVWNGTARSASREDFTMPACSNVPAVVRGVGTFGLSSHHRPRRRAIVRRVRVPIGESAWGDRTGTPTNSNPKLRHVRTDRCTGCGPSCLRLTGAGFAVAVISLEFSPARQGSPRTG